MRNPTRGAHSMAIALATALALLAGCETTPTASSAATAAAVPVQSRSVPTAGSSAPVTTAAAVAVAPQSRVATVDLAAPKSGGSATAFALSRPPSVGAGAGTSAVAATALMAVPRDRIIFFDFDSYVIKDDFKGLLDGHAKSLAGSRAKGMTIEGHTDERGGREYNLALGQKRAEAVVRSLTLLGVSEQQLEAVSFGEERPLQQGTNEAAWTRNRRAELKDR